jgi:glutamate/tyrosine decarboxylase-like PLP-dependent enzyme
MEDVAPDRAERAPHDQGAATLGGMVDWAVATVSEWEQRFGGPVPHPALDVDQDRLDAAWDEFTHRMDANFPFFHPRFAGQMLKPPHPVAVAGYLAAMLVNPNNHALDGGPVTSGMEREVVAELAAMFRLPVESLGHLTSSGTIANLEALWVARELHPGKAVVHGANAHYTHGRMCQVLGVPAVAVATDDRGHLDLSAADAACRQHDVGTVVLTAGSTGLGTVDDVHQALVLRDRHGVRLHVDAAYGGFFSVLAWADPDTTAPHDTHVPPVPAEALRAIAECDSVVVDPHKHGLQPYGCGAVLFRDPGVGRLYRHSSPYTYFTSDELHLGEISLECSKAGAAAAALWLTLRVLPLSAGEGLGPILAAGRRAALRLAGALEAPTAADAPPSPLRLHRVPELDIVTYFPYRPGATSADVSGASDRMLHAGMQTTEEPVWLSTLRVEAGEFATCHPDIPLVGGGPVTVLRSVLMKPEHEPWVERLHARLVALADAALAPAADP